MVVLGWGGNQFLPLMPLYRDVIGYTQVDVDLFLAFYVLGLVPGFVLSGSLSDRFGRKPIILAALVIAAAGSALIASGGAVMIVMCLGRMLSGLGVAAAMVAGSSWLKQLAVAEGCGAPGARRASLALSIGFGGGAGIAGVLAQFVALPTVVPYAVHVVACLVAFAAVVGVDNTERVGVSRGLGLREMCIPQHAHATFWTRVAPTAPWIFGAAALSFAFGPSLVKDQVGSSQVIFATLVTLLTLGSGTATQLASAPIDRVLRGRSGPVGAICVALGACILALASVTGQPLIVVLAAPVFGCGYGLCMVAGLALTQSLARPEELAGLTATFYALSYLGFFLPLAFAALAPIATGSTMLLLTAAVIVVCAAVAGRPGRP
ncbi:Bacillibactin exporter [Frondihabitans sp. 762G35]|nr:Bacillibactin exporter [Frondihabitans sp. 762G35]